MRTPWRLLAFALVALGAAGCQRSGDPSLFAGRWVLEQETRAGFTRSCAPLIFEEGQGSFTVDPSSGRLRIVFDDIHRTVLAGQVEGTTLVARHLMPTSEIGRVCGQDLQVVVRLRRSEGADGERLEGSWRPAACAICPGVVLTAVRPAERQILPAAGR